ncbi:putative phospholipase activating protein [Encephalitozoon intestinalis ATCC 50506]|uniref:Phospholipase activating protein n=1 Tax=Encephalitozoon intestinalis (strain ATCC 50506) TaxID=876142 RepID=E0S961_ENCIT|nr:putative phospholipase activating protein [Encephalitozoon intestinalis ATCC 50506]ADM12304.1 putative phospholipase activating protein [Encephalitozoon intestinalis ATCC 50506]UTX46115.1 PFU domain-containing protein [Encephalitozoon intestinalis]
MIGIEKIEKISNSDVKALFVNDEMIITGGREGVIRIYGYELGCWAEIKPGQGYINCITTGNGFLFVGCQNGCIVMYSMDELGAQKEEQKVEPMRLIKEHSSNVCCLDTVGDLVVSSSWDCSAIIWTTKHILNGNVTIVQKIPHPAVVWSAKFVNENTVVTGCSDKLVRVFKNGTLACTFNYNLSYVRGVALLHKSIISVDNEGMILKISLDGRILKHYSAKDFMYTISSCTNGDSDLIICAGENGKVVILNEDLKLVQEILVPTTSCWAVLGWKGRVYVGGSDGRLYVYSSDISDEASRILEEIRNSKEAPLKDGEFISDGQKFRVTDGSVYQEINGEWVFLGKGEGIKPHDNTFQVELENKYYTLSFNNDENVYEVAEKFLSKNKLRDEFRDDIVDFIKKNFTSAREFKTYSRINVEGIKNMLNRVKDDHGYLYPYILDNLERPKIADNGKVEEEIEKLIENGLMFMALDLIRYFMVHKYSFDLSFLPTFTPQDKKEAITFVRLLSNLFIDPPFNLEMFHSRVLELKDRGVVDGEVLDDYFVNRSLRNRA